MSPITYRGYNSEGNVIVTKTGYDANNYINPADVKKAVENLETVAEEQMNIICNALNNIAPDADEAIIVQGTKMTETIEEICTALKEIPASIVNSVSEISLQAQTVHDQLQDSENTYAHNIVASYDGVQSVN